MNCNNCNNPIPERWLRGLPLVKGVRPADTSIKCPRCGSENFIPPKLQRASALRSLHHQQRAIAHNYPHPRTYCGFRKTGLGARHNRAMKSAGMPTTFMPKSIFEIREEEKSKS